MGLISVGISTCSEKSGTELVTSEHRKSEQGKRGKSKGEFTKNKDDNKKSREDSMTQNFTPYQWNTLDRKAPLIIAHRGASGRLPEHTLAGYDLAIDFGADYIEPDLVITKDGVLVARHDRYLSTTTDIADHEEFAKRKTVKEGHDGADWFVEDFTLAEIKTLRAVQPRAGRSPQWDRQFEIPTFEEILQLANQRSQSLGRRIGVYPETKHPKALEALGLSFDEPLLSLLNKYGYKDENDPVFIQSFETENLIRLRPVTNIRFIYLVDKAPEIKFAQIAKFANGIGPYKLLLTDAEGRDNGFIRQAHDAGLAVHPWTFRDDDVSAIFDGDGRREMEHYMRLGIDGLFSDFADTAYSVRQTLSRASK